MNFKKITTAIALTISVLTISACSTATDDFDVQSDLGNFDTSDSSNYNMNSSEDFNSGQGNNGGSGFHDGNYQEDGASTVQDFGGGDLNAETSLNAAFDSGNTKGAFQPLPASQQFFKPIYFARNRYTIGTAETLVLDKLALYLKTNTNLHLTVEGHCSIRGSEEFNMSLGEKRAQAVSLFLESRGIAVSRLHTVSYGEERPAVAGNTESAHAANRRCVLVLGRVN